MGEKNADKIGFVKFTAWSVRSISTGIQAVLLSFLLIYCTNALGLNAAIVGTMLMGSKIIDGITDIFSGYIIDRTNTKWGRGRPYELAVIGLWLTTWLLFSAPEGATTTVKYVWVFVCYVMSQTIFTTLLNANQTVYMVRAFKGEQQYVFLNSIGGLITTFGVIVFNVVFPIFEAKIIYSAPGWSKLIGAIAIPLTIIGLMRFFFVKEDEAAEAVESEKIKRSDIMLVLKNNKQIYVVAMMMFISAVLASLGVSNYYYLYVVKNVEISGVMSLLGVAAMISLVFYPMIMKKMSAAKLIQLTSLFMIPGGILNFIAYDNLGILAIAGLLLGLASLPISFMNNLLIIECATYNEWKGYPRMESTMTCITGFANKLGAAFGAFLLGVLLEIGNFDGLAKVQEDSAIWMIRFIFGILPLIAGVLIIIILIFYNLDKKKVQMETEIMERNEMKS